MQLYFIVPNIIIYFYTRVEIYRRSKSLAKYQFIITNNSDHKTVAILLTDRKCIAFFFTFANSLCLLWYIEP
jgi:hypothetical protein